MVARDFAAAGRDGGRGARGGCGEAGGDRDGAELSAVRDDGRGGKSDGSGGGPGAGVVRLSAPADRYSEHAVRGVDSGAEDGADRPDYFIDDGDG